LEVRDNAEITVIGVWCISFEVVLCLIYLFGICFIAGVVKGKMNFKLYVGNLSYSTTEDELRTLFLRAGTVVSVSLITDRESHVSKGFAFVEMGNQAEALKAIEMFDGRILGDQELRVSMAHHVNARTIRGLRQ